MYNRVASASLGVRGHAVGLTTAAARRSAGAAVRCGMRLRRPGAAVGGAAAMVCW